MEAWRCDDPRFSEQDRDWFSQSSFPPDVETRPREIRGPHNQIHMPPHVMSLPVNYSWCFTKAYLLSLAPKACPDPPLA